MTAGGPSNILSIARRELVVRARTRSYLFSTLFLVLAAALVACAPVAIGYLGRDSTRVAVYVGAAGLRGDPVATLDALLNPPAAVGSAGGDGTSARRPFAVERSSDLDADRRRVLEGGLAALLDVERDASGGGLAFTVYTMEPANGRTAVISRQAATSIAVADRLGRVGLTPADQASLFAPPAVVVRSADLARATPSPEAAAQHAADVAVTTSLEMFLLLAIVLYGTWVTQSVVEEKSSRMMEILIVAATPFQLLAGKVIGVSAVALLQFAAALAAAFVALAAQDVVAAQVLGESAGPALPSGVTPAILVAFAAFFVLGFVLYAVLFAAAGSLLSRQEDVNQAVMPLTLGASAGCMLAVYGTTGTVDANAGWVVASSWVPLIAPFTMLSRLNAGSAGPAEAAIALGLMVATIVAATWVAGRIYSAGVLLYGQRPSIARTWQAIRQAS